MITSIKHSLRQQVRCRECQDSCTNEAPAQTLRLQILYSSLSLSLSLSFASHSHPFYCWVLGCIEPIRAVGIKKHRPSSVAQCHVASSGDQRTVGAAADHEAHRPDGVLHIDRSGLQMEGVQEARSESRGSFWSFHPS